MATLETFVEPATGLVTVEAIKEKDLPTVMARFYYNFALAEGRASR